MQNILQNKCFSKRLLDLIAGQVNSNFNNTKNTI